MTISSKNYIVLYILIYIVSFSSCNQKTNHSNTESEGSKTTQETESNRPEPKAVEVEVSENDYTLGNPDAPVTLIEFSDFECPSCKDFYALVENLKEDYIETGKVYFVFKNFPLDSHPQSMKAAVAARCAGNQDPQKFWDMYQKLFEAEEQFSKVFYTSLAEELELDTEAFQQCLDDPFVMRDVRLDKRAGTQIGISGTPTFIINGEMYSGVPPEEVLIEMIEEKL